MQDTDKAETAKSRVDFGYEYNQNSGTTRFNESYLKSEANKLRSKARKEARAAGFEPIFDKGFVLVINERQNTLGLQVHFDINGSHQIYGMAI